MYQEDEGFRVGEFLGYAWPFAIGTVVAAVMALILATPVAVGVALYISHYAPPRASKTIGYIIDLLAAIPSVVYGAWGWLVLAPQMVGFYQWLSDNLGFIPFFGGSPSATGRTIVTASVVLAVMILPIIASVSREIFIQTPKLHEEAALALGATRWEMIRMAVLPFARAGIISGIMLGLGRALGETMAVVMVLSGAGFSLSLISASNSTIPARSPTSSGGAAAVDALERADCSGAGALHHHPGRERDRPLGGLAEQRILGSQLMSETDTRIPTATSVAGPAGPLLRGRAAPPA